MSETDSPAIEETEPEIVHWYPPRRRLPEATAVRTGAFGAVAIGAIAIGAFAIGALAIGRLVVGRARIRDLQIDRLTVGALRVIERK